MKEQDIARVYAKAFVELSAQTKSDLSEEFITFTTLVDSSNDLENLLFLDVFSNEEKSSVVRDLGAKAGFSKAFEESINYLIEEKRINLLPFITNEMSAINDQQNNLLRGVIEGDTEDIPEEYKNKLVGEIKKYFTNKNMQIAYVQKKDITSGYTLTVDSYQIDASVDKQLDRFKNFTLSN